MPVENHAILPVEINQLLWEKDAEAYLQQKVTACEKVIWAVDPADFNALNQIQDALFEIGVAAQKAYWQCNENMTYPLQRMTEDSHSNQAVTDLLAKLHRYIADIRPPRKARPSLKERFLLLFSLRETAWQMWLDNYQTAKQKIDLLIKQLDATKQQLKRDNQILSNDQKKLLKAEQWLRHDYDLVQTLYAALKLRISTDEALNQTQIDLAEQQFIDPLVKREIELQQQLLIARQAMMTLDLMIKHQVSLVRHIEQAVYTSTAVLDVTAGLLLVQSKQAKLQQQITTNNAQPIASSVELDHARNIIKQALDDIKLASADKTFDNSKTETP